MDSSGESIREFLASRGAEPIGFTVVPDEKEKIERLLREAALDRRVGLVILTGGTGLGPRDVTPEAVSAVSERNIPGIGEKLRADGAISHPPWPG